MTRRRALMVAATGGFAAFLLLLIGARLRGWLPFIGGALAYAGLLWALRRGPESSLPEPERQVALPDGMARADHDAALASLASAASELQALADNAPAGDRARLRHMAALIETIREHHIANPAHLSHTRIFVRHTLGRMIGAVAGYVDLANRARPEDDDRLAGIRQRLDGFIPVLERIERACFENDLMALEISVEVLDEQLGRDGRLS